MNRTLLRFSNRSLWLCNNYPSKLEIHTVNTADGPSPSARSLYSQIEARIKAGGPITVAHYMREVLTNVHAGYYMNRDVFGATGDFVTSPEISQMFGELLAVWLVNEWRKAGCPRPLQIVELGPGRGTLMSDVLRIMSRFRIIDSDFCVGLVEVSPHLSHLQELRLCGEKKSDLMEDAADDGHYKSSRTIFGCPVRWYHQLSDIPKHFTLYLAHEFFDALPVHKLVKDEKGWREVLIDTAGPNSLRYILSRERTPACRFVRENEERDQLEVSPQSLVIIQEMSRRIHRDGGISLIIDYGHEGNKKDTFRAFKDHKLYDPLLDPGTADLTADVDFSALKWAIGNSSVLAYGTVNQGSFLKEMGIDLRLEQLIKSTGQAEMQQLLQSARDMLTVAMGERFKVMSLFPAAMKGILDRYPPCGFGFPDTH